MLPVGTFGSMDPDEIINDFILDKSGVLRTITLNIVKGNIKNINKK